MKIRYTNRPFALRAMTENGIRQCYMLLLYKSVVLSMGLTTLSQSKLLKLKIVQTESKKVVFQKSPDDAWWI